MDNDMKRIVQQSYHEASVLAWPLVIVFGISAIGMGIYSWITSPEVIENYLVLIGMGSAICLYGIFLRHKCNKYVQTQK